MRHQKRHTCDCDSSITPRDLDTGFRLSLLSPQTTKPNAFWRQAGKESGFGGVPETQRGLGGEENEENCCAGTRVKKKTCCEYSSTLDGIGHVFLKHPFFPKRPSTQLQFQYEEES